MKQFTLFQKRLSKLRLLPIILILILVIHSNLFLDPSQPLKFFLLATLCFIGNAVIILKYKSLISSKLTIIYLVVFLIYVLLNLFSLGKIADLFTAIYEVLKLFLIFNFSILSIHYLKSKGHAFATQVGYGFAALQLITIAFLIYAAIGNPYYSLFSSSKLYGGLFTNPNLSSQMLFFCIPMVLYASIVSEKKLHRLGLKLVLLFSVLALLLLNSWAVFLALILFICCVLFFFFLSSKVAKRYKITGIVFLLLGIICLPIILQSSFLEKRSFGHRSVLWNRSLQLIEEAPILGSGAGSWRIKNLNFSPQESSTSINSGINTIAGDVFYERPHNDFLWIWSETGAIGLLTYLLLFGILFFASFRLIQNSKNERKLLAVFLCSFLISYLLIAFFSFPKERIEQSMILALYATIILSLYDDFNNKKIHLKKGFNYLLIVPILISGFAVFIGYYHLEADFYMRNAVEAKRNKNWHGTLLNAQRANNKFSPIASDGTPVYWYRGIAEMELNFVKRAHSSFSKAYQLHPTHLYVLNNLATTSVLSGDTNSAISLYNKALQINPIYEDARINLSGTYYNQGNIEAAWDEIIKIPLESKNRQYPLFANTIIRSKFEEEIQQEALDKELGEDLINYLNSTENAYFYAFKKMQMDSVSYPSALFNQLGLFIEKQKKED